jgi:Flp pilus assembly protein TadG
MNILRRLRGFRSPRVRSELGEALVEFAVATILIVTAILGQVDFGRWLFAYNAVSKTARQGVRYAAVRGYTAGADTATAADIQSYVATQSLGHVTTGNVTVKTIDAAGTNEADWPTNDKPGRLVKITATYTFTPTVLPWLPQAARTVSSTAYMVIAR